MELWDAYHRDGTLAGKDLVRGDPIPNGLYHIICEALVRHVDGDYLLMQRDYGKPNNGGMYEASACGSAVKGEDIYQCIHREILEETGIDTNNLTPIGNFISKDALWYGFLALTDIDKNKITLQKGETIGYKWLSEKDFIDFVNSDEMIDWQRELCRAFFVEKGYIKSEGEV